MNLFNHRKERSVSCTFAPCLPPVFAALGAIYVYFICFKIFVVERKVDNLKFMSQ